MATSQFRWKRLWIPLLAITFIVFNTLARAQQGPAARVVTRVDSQLDPSLVVTVEAQSDSTLNNDLLNEFRSALQLSGRLADDKSQNAAKLQYNAEPFGTVSESDTSVGRVQKRARGDVDIELKLWSTGGGSSLFQGRERNETITAGFRLNALLVDGEKILWQGYVLTGPEEGNGVSALAPLVQTLIDRLDISVDETIPLR